MSLEGMVCPKCEAQLHFEDDKEYCFCSSCGTQIFKDTDSTIRIKQTIINEDKAKIIEAENKVKELEFEERESIRKRKDFKFKLIVGVILAIIYVIILALAYTKLGEFYAIAIFGFTILGGMYFLPIKKE